jgi:enoyl-CoA hydratase
MTYQFLECETFKSVGLTRLNRPKALNALDAALIGELSHALEAFDDNNDIGCIVLTGSEKAFAAGADIKEMKDKRYDQVLSENFITEGGWEKPSRVRKPLIAAVSGYALGGGCELALMCDFIIAADTAKFGQPEITLGTIPGIGGTQRLARFIGKSKAMDLCLTGRMMDAEEAERCGLVARVVPADKLLQESLEIAAQIASYSRPIVKKAKEAVNRAYETSLSEGLLFERRVFHATFATEDQKEGMRAFAERRPANWQHR